MSQHRQLALSPPLTRHPVNATVVPYDNDICVLFCSDVPDYLNDGYIPSALLGAITLTRNDGRIVASGLVNAVLVAQSQVDSLVTFLVKSLLSEDGADHCNIAIVERSSGLAWSGEETLNG